MITVSTLAATLFLASPVGMQSTDVTAPGANIQRTMKLLSERRPSNEGPVKILFYGQSITAQRWWQKVEQDLKRRFPNANMVVENKAIGGFSADKLSRIAPIDIPAFQPDLVILHDYGSMSDYVDMVRMIRRTTTAEVLLQTDHVDTRPVRANAGLAKRRNASDDEGPVGDPDSRASAIIDLARDLHCGVVDVRRGWKSELNRGVQADSLLRDTLHLNQKGMDLMARLVSQYLVRDPSQSEGLPPNSVRTFDDPKWDGNRIKIEFDGNRVDVIPSGGGDAKFLIDGKSPSEFPGVYTYSRATEAPNAIFPVLIGVESEAKPLVEEWTATLTNVSPNGQDFDFSLQGSKTGPDGSGTSTRRFRSNSGRVAIDPRDWALAFAYRAKKSRINDGFQVKWAVVPMFKDQAQLSGGPITVAQGLANGRHTLEIIASKPGGVDKIVSYKPPLQ
jgi:hypothetical protein